MAGGTAEPPPYTRLLEKLQGDVSTGSLSCSIFRVPNHLRQISEKAYEPQVISIGPYHHGKGQLKAMEVHKMSFLKMQHKIRLGEYVTALERKEEEARKFYSEPLNHISREQFVDIMLLDGCFIIGLIQNMIPLPDFLLRRVMRDLLLVENQLPFSVLSELFDMTHHRQASDFTYMAIDFFSGMMPGSQNERIVNGVHLLGLLHHHIRRSSTLARRSLPRPAPSTPWLCFKRPPSAPPRPPPPPARPAPSTPWLCFKRPPPPPPRPPYPSADPRPRRGSSVKREWRFISSAIELSEAGINFKKIEGRLFDIKFENGVMSIPTLSITDDTESILRNLVAYEQCFEGESSNCFTDYLTFMDCLINTGKDVELLCHRGVIDNCLGDHEVVATLFNRVRDSVLISEEHFSYEKIFNEVNTHCNRKCNLWKANLWHNYFNTPWALISFLAAVFLLVFTALQSVYSVLSYHHK